MVLHENPYQPSLQSEVINERVRVTNVLWWMAYVHPAIALGLVYACWGLTCFSLGRPPGFGEHPEGDIAHRVVHALGFPAMLLILGTPVLVPLALVGIVFQPYGARRTTGSRIRARVACLTSYLLMLMAVAWVCYADPFGVWYWFMD